MGDPKLGFIRHRELLYKEKNAQYDFAEILCGVSLLNFDELKNCRVHDFTENDPSWIIDHSPDGFRDYVDDYRREMRELEDNLAFSDEYVDNVRVNRKWEILEKWQSENYCALLHCVWNLLDCLSSKQIDEHRIHDGRYRLDGNVTTMSMKMIRVTRACIFNGLSCKLNMIELLLGVMCFGDLQDTISTCSYTEPIFMHGHDVTEVYMDNFVRVTRRCEL